MKSLVASIAVLVTMGLQTAPAQLAGTYTLGGDAPDFDTFQEAADSLLTVGVAGTVSILVRPGLYTAGDGSLRVLDLSGEIPGATSSTRVRFGPDLASGASSANVILRRSSGTREDGYVVQIKSSHTTVEGFTVELSDTTAVVAEIPSLVYLEAVTDAGVNNLKVDGLGGRRTWRCIMMISIENDVFATNNQVTNCIEAIYQRNFGGPRADRLTITGNHMTGMSTLPERRDPEYGLHMRLDGGGADVVVSDNVVDFRGASGITGIGIIEGAPKERLRVERNQVIGLDVNLGFSGSGHLLQVGDAPGGLIANNFLSGDAYRTTGARLIMNQHSDSLTFAHNTVRVGGGSCHALVAVRDNRVSTFLRVIDNILITEGNCANFAHQHMNFTSTDSSNAEIDYNVHSFRSGINLAVDNVGGFYADLPAWQDAGFGEHSAIYRPEFVDEPNDYHLGECAFEDETLRGTPLLDVPLDIDSEGRDALLPFIGADEQLGRPPAVFAAPSIFAAGRGPFQLASGDLDGDGDIDLAVTNPGSFGGGIGDDDVTILLNDGVGTFGEPQHLTFGTDPNNIAIGKINEDDVPDLVVRGDDGVIVRFGLGGGNFSAPVTVGTIGTNDLELADYDNDGDTDIFVLQSPTTDSSRAVVWVNEGNGTFVFNKVWTVARYGNDLELADLDRDGFLDLLVVDASSTGHLYTMRNLGNQAPGVTRGYEKAVAYAFSVSSDPVRSRFLVDDFDGDLDPDVVLGSFAAGNSLVLVRNDGSGVLGDRQTFEAHRVGVPEQAVKLDYEGDGDLDLVAASQSATVDLLLNNGSGQFERIVLCSSGALSGFPVAVQSALLDDDTSDDVAVLTFAPGGDGSIEVLRNLNWMPSGVATEDPGAPGEMPTLHPNYPNPFSYVTTVRYSLSDPSPVRLDVFDLLGRRVATVFDGVETAGDHTVQFDAGGLASGIYLYRIRAGSFVETRRMVVVR